jgi:hypothetical protein
MPATAETAGAAAAETLEAAAEAFAEADVDAARSAIAVVRAAATAGGAEALINSS